MYVWYVRMNDRKKELSKLLILDVADMGGPNLVCHRHMESMIDAHDFTAGFP